MAMRFASLHELCPETTGININSHHNDDPSDAWGTAWSLLRHVTYWLTREMGRAFSMKALPWRSY